MAKLKVDYQSKIQAMEFVVAADDRFDWTRLDKADIILVGASGTAKTPLALYLGYQGYKAANLPLVPELDFGREKLIDYKAKIIGLTIDEDSLKKHRKRKLLDLGLGLDVEYVTDDRIRYELEYAQRVMNKLRSPIINVTDKRIEKLAFQVKELYRNK
ncbi:kinase/pyrophosphorylase, partial [Halobacteroides halobius]|uniref:kinase/pyrophosphorylase n=1 Tax=Halobacteroides halobius TaxID=42422 RepID=UPI0005A13699